MSSSADRTLRRNAERAGLQLYRSRTGKPPLWLKDPKSGQRWGDRTRGLTQRQVDDILRPRLPARVRKDGSNQLPRLNWAPIIAKAKRIVESYDTRVTLRQLFYQLVARQIFENDQNRYKRLSALTAEARRDSDFPDLIDQTSEILVAQYFTSPQQALDRTRSIYRRDRTEGQEVTIYLAVEKAGIQNQLWHWFGIPLGLPILALGGYGSQTFKDDVKTDVTEYIYVDVIKDGVSFEVRADADMIAELTLDDYRPAVLIYAGDHDASGDDIFRDFVMRTDPYARLSDDYTTVTRSRLWTAVHRIALNKDQVWNEDGTEKLPQNPGKDTDSRTDAFMERHDYDENIQVELDALAPDVLRDLYQAAIDLYWDRDTYDAVMEREDDERVQLDIELDEDDEDDDPDTIADY